MPGSFLLTLTLVAVALLPAVALGLLRAHRPSHALPQARSLRRHVGAPAAALGAGGALCALLLGAGWLGGAVTALVLATAVVVQARRSVTWRIPGVVAWVLLVVATASFLAWLGLQVLEFGGATATLGGGVAWLLLVLAATRIRPHAREAVARSSRRDLQPTADGAEVEPPLAWLVTGAASVSLVLAFGVGAALAPDDRPSPAAEEDAPSDGASGVPAVVSPSASERPSPTPDSSRTPGRAARMKSADPTPEPVTATITAPQEPRTSDPAPQQPLDPTKTPGYAKEKPNRPSDAPTPGSGRRGPP